MTKWLKEKDELERLINVEHVSYEEIGRRYGVTGTAIKKAAKRCGINITPRRKVNDKEHFNRGKARFGKCLNCGCDFLLYKSTTGKYCCSQCKADYEFKDYIKKWKNGEENGTKGRYEISNYIRKYLLMKHNNSCQICGWDNVNLYTGKVPLQIHHIDGNCLNNSEDNLQLLCPNCHSLTENFGSRNKNAVVSREERLGLKNKLE